ncbi:hypothetical protein MMC22_009197 [Lobaria immixta]|nr:hypothetical protein [Lobaria immixta]
MFTINLDTTIIATAIPHVSDEFHAIDQDGCTFLRTTTSFQSTREKGFQYLALKPNFLVAITALIVGHAIADLDAGADAGANAGAGAGAGADGTTPGIHGRDGWKSCVGHVLGPLHGWISTKRPSWRWFFYINIPIEGCRRPWFFTFKNSCGSSSSTSDLEGYTIIDRLGWNSLNHGFHSLLSPRFAIGWRHEAWSDSTIIGTLVEFGLLVIAFVISEGHVRGIAFLQPQLLGQRRI